MVASGSKLPVMRWIKPNVKGNKPSARYFHSMTMLGDAVVVIGGKDDHNRFTDVHVFNKDMRCCLWTQPSLKGVSPKPRSAHTINVVGTKIFVFGGHRDKEKFNDIHILDTSSMSWVHPKVKGTPPLKRNAHTTTVVAQQLYVFGGFNGESCNDLHIFDTDALEWIQPKQSGQIPPPRCCHTATHINGRLWVFAGKNNDSGGVIERHNDVHSMNVTTFNWENHTRNIKGVPPSKRNAHTACRYKNNLLIFGGFDGDSCNDLFLLDTEALVWHEIITTSVAPTARYCHAAVSYQVDERSWAMLCYGGCDSDHNYSDVQILEITDGGSASGAELAQMAEKVKQLEEEKARLNKIVDAQHETITRLKEEKQQLQDQGNSSDEDDSESKKKRKKKKKKKKKLDNDASSLNESETKGSPALGSFEDGLQHSTSNASLRQQPRPPAHLTPLNLQKMPFPRAGNDQGVPNSCPTRPGDLSSLPTKPPNALFPPLKS